jgi:hypothetical protein
VIWIVLDAAGGAYDLHALLTDGSWAALAQLHRPAVVQTFSTVDDTLAAMAAWPPDRRKHFRALQVED